MRWITVAARVRATTASTEPDIEIVAIAPATTTATPHVSRHLLNHALHR